LKNKILDYLSIFLVSGVIVILDQITKAWIRQNLMIGEVYRPELWLSNYARLIYWKNTGAAFGIFQNLGGVFMVLSIIVAGIILFYYPQIPRRDWLIRLSMALLLGGAVGNLIDRLTLGHVVDFISVGNFPVFNIADASISTGVVVLFIGMWVQERRKKIEHDNLNEENSASNLSERIQLKEEIERD
jgi:signal peptidase II